MSIESRRVEFVGNETGRVLADILVDAEVRPEQLPIVLDRELKVARQVLANSGGHYEQISVKAIEEGSLDPVDL